MDPVGDALVPGDGWFQEESSVWRTATVALATGAALLAWQARARATSL